MHVHRTNQHADFTVLANCALQNKTLSFRARGLLGYLLSRPDGAQEDCRRLAEEHPEGRRGVADALNELKAAGYYFVVTWKSRDGRFCTETHVYDTPQQQAPAPGPGERPEGGAGAKPVKNREKETTPRGDAVNEDRGDRDDDGDGGDDGDGHDHDDHDDEPPPPSPPVAEPSTALSGAAALLHRIVRGEPRLRLGVPEAAKLAPLVAEWLADGATEAELRAALTTGLPRVILAPVGLLKHRLIHKRPPARVPEQPDPVAVTPVPRRHECDDCRAPLPAPGLCRACAAPDVPAPPNPAVAATRRGAAVVRAALRGITVPAACCPA
ncbi:hypothetical protein [Streptacidiphilus carbonis]|uniref:hypothetical protein n=1 Tax=Streptacidiphilus carbonis TaxID=105422 RepID=UPI0005A70F9B|nr:hypothetical protein [Streptacidiphilus carbonis]